MREIKPKPSLKIKAKSSAPVKAVIFLFRRRINGPDSHPHLIRPASGTVALKSLSKYGVPGGVGDDADMIRNVLSRRADGSWSEAADGWSYQSTNEHGETI
jgi:hypothetical protein